MVKFIKYNSRRKLAVLKIGQLKLFLGPVCIDFTLSNKIVSSFVSDFFPGIPNPKIHLPKCNFNNIISPFPISYFTLELIHPKSNQLIRLIYNSLNIITRWQNIILRFNNEATQRFPAILNAYSRHNSLKVLNHPLNHEIARENLQILQSSSKFNQI